LAGCGGGGGSSSAARSSTIATSARGATSTTNTDTSGGGGESAPSALGSKRAVQTAVNAVLTSKDPAGACGKYVTERYLRVAYGGKQGCVRAQQPGSGAEALSSFRIDQEGGQGTVVSASAVPHGGPYNGSKVEIGLVFDTDHYRVDALHTNVPVGP
jgi:hypothetical protein